MKKILTAADSRKTQRLRCALVSVLAAVLLAGRVQAQQCYAWVNATTQNLYATPEAACVGESYTTVISFYPTTSTVQNTMTLGALQGVDGPSYWCVETQTISGTPAVCQALAGSNSSCGTHEYPETGGAGPKALPGVDCTALYYVSLALLSPLAQTSCPDCVKDPINPGTGSVFATETDVQLSGGVGAIAYQRFYNSADTTGVDYVPGWRHSYDRSISAIYQSSGNVYPGQSATVSQQYATPAEACTQGFTAIQASVSAWANATATYNDGVCVVSNSTSTLGTLPIQAWPIPDGSSSIVEYDVIRDDGRTLRYTLQNGVINNQPGVSLQLVATASGFTVTDDQDNVESYSSAGVLQSITTRSGIVQTLAYNSSGQWSGVTDSFGNSLTVTRDPQGTISQITLSGGGEVQYGYDSLLRLSTVTNLDGTTRSYVYGDSNATNALTAVVDENGTTYSTWTYNQGQATQTQEAGGANASTLTYNSNGSTTWTDALGAVRTFSYTRIGDVNQVVSISGSQCPTCQDSAATTYDSAGWVSSRTDYDGNVTCYANDPVRGLELVRVEGFGPGTTCPTNLTSYTPATGTTQRKITTTWSASYRLPVLITEPTRTLAFSYDGNGNLLSETITDTTVSPNVSRTWTYTYNGYGQVLMATGPRTDLNSTTTYTYYSCTTGAQCGQVQTVTDAVGHVTTFNSYNAYGEPLSITDANGVVTTLAYDTRERLTSRTTSGETTGFTYYPTGLLARVTLPDDSALQYTYDGAHRLIQVADGLGNTVSYTLDALGNQTVQSNYDPSNTLSLTMSRVFNSLSELYQWVGAAGTSAVTTTYGYDSNGNQTSIAAPLSRNTAEAYDALNRLVQVTDPNGGNSYFGYDSNDDLTSVTDPRRLVTQYGYDGFGDVTSLQSPDTGTTSNTYDSAGNLKTTTDARGATATYSYDALNRLTQAAYSDQTINYTYDTGTNGKGHLTGASDSAHSMAWQYDALGEVISKSQTVSGTTLSVSYSYTNADLATLTTPSGQTIGYTYSNHQVTSITVNGTTLLSNVAYEPFGPVRGWAWGNGTQETHLYNTDGNPSEVSAIETTNYTEDSAFRITAIANASNPALSWSYGYDSLDRLTSASTSSASLSWTYDGNGNRLTQAGTPSLTTPLVTTYNGRGRLSSVTVNGATTNYLYNALGERIEKSGGPAGTILYCYDEAGHLLGEYTSAGALIEETVWLGDTPVATLQLNSGGTVTVYYIHADHLGSPKMITRPTDNAILWRWDEDPFGSAAPNQNPSEVGTFTYSPRFPGQYYDQETGLNYDYSRDYDPTVGRYVESDPIGLLGGINTYSYTFSNPINLADPSGLFSVSLAVIEQALARAGLAEAAGLGPEDPLADVAAAIALTGTIALASDAPSPTATKNCSNDDDCARLYAQIDAAVNRVKRRYYQLIENKLNLPTTGPFSIETHQGAYTNEQIGLHRLLDEANAKGCLGYNADAWKWATRPTPSPGTPTAW